MAKVLVEIYFTYGKQDGEELRKSYTVVDSKGMREELYDYWTEYAAYVEGNKDAFTDGEINEVFIESDGGDWDDPTGYGIVITTYAQKKEEIERRYKQDLERLKTQFGVEDE